jgi:hypothetical protein
MVKKVNQAEIDLYLKTLAETPQKFLTWAESKNETDLRSAASGEWSFVEIVAHVRGCSEVWTYSIFAMLTVDDPVLAYIHPRAWTKMQGYETLSFAENYQAFKVGRDNLLRILNGLTFDGWNRAARFADKANVYTVFGETLRMARHEMDHCNQLETTTSSQ